METSGIGQTEIQGAPAYCRSAICASPPAFPALRGRKNCKSTASRRLRRGCAPAGCSPLCPAARTDGRQYIPDALRAGAVAVLYPTEAKAPAEDILPAGTAVGIPLPPDAPARAVFARLVSAWYGDPGRRLHRSA